MAGVKSSNITRGHRFLSSGEITVRRFEDYEKKLRDCPCHPRRRRTVVDIILHEVLNRRPSRSAWS